MSFTAITTPSSPAGAYDYQALRYQFTDNYAYTAIGNNGGLLQLTVAGATASAVTVGDFLWIESLVNFPNIDSPVVEVTATGATTITVNVAYSASYTATGDLRAMEVAEFTISTGGNNTNNPERQRDISLRPDPNGVYSINPYQEVISRFIYGAPIIGADARWAYSIGYEVFLTSAGSSSGKVALMTNTGSGPGSVIRYNGVNNIVTYIPSGTNYFLTALESATTGEIESAGTVTEDIEMYIFDCVSYDRTFSVPFDEGFTTFDTEDWLTVNVTGQNVTSVTFDFSGEDAGEFTWSIEFDDGVNVKTFNFTFYLQNTIDCRQSCGGRRFVWWSRAGAWCQYEFNRTMESEVTGGAAQLKQIDNVISAVRYDKQQDSLVLLADYEGETIFDHLREILYSLNIYEVIELTDIVENFDPYYLSSANGVPKKTQPFLATSNRIQYTVTRGTISERISEGR